MKDIPQLLDLYKKGPKSVADRVATLSEAELDAVPVAGMWSIREVVCHIADFEIISADRLKRVLAEDNPTLFDCDPDLLTEAFGKTKRPVDVELAVISSVRKSTAAILDACDIEDFQRTGVHSAEGPMTLEALLERTINHVPHHLKFVDEKIAALNT